MTRPLLAFMVLASLLLPAIPSFGAKAGDIDVEGTIFTLWPLIDYRESPKEQFSNLGILGPLIKIQENRGDSVVAFRPLFHNSANKKQGTSVTEYLYPLASSETTPEVSRFQFLKLIQNNNFRKDEAGGGEKDSMFFPFYISGTSKKYGPYTSVFPIYGDIYERFWKDEYHYALFPLYGSTVKNGTTSRNYLYPLFNTLEGDKESGFQVWPLYGQSAKEGVYRKRFVLWPFVISDTRGLNTANPTEKLFLLPFYTATDSPDKTERGYFWPFCGYRDDRKLKEQETDFLWPFIWTVRGEERRVDSYLPFYSGEVKKESSKHWYLWPLFRNDTLTTDTFSRDRNRVLYFLYSDSLERWAKDGSERKRTALWPMFVYQRDPRGVKTFSFPALVEPILDRGEIEQNWSPLWRIYQQKWTDSGESVVSFLWSLYWHEIRDDATAYEFYPLLFYRGKADFAETSIFKGLVRYKNVEGEKSLKLLWLPFGLNWGAKVTGKGSAPITAGGGL
ncbi:hypothetical protein OR1_03733 [Geobacter sp. OR-1]|uniref:hypothetical protein n=1 Tax=Geobacter sp. OR-1 TaxID=1266765 RepID=UPI000544212C|nr:hypothetical protein [Geobacter sp. OR-1]GAM11417.1 hypothetical protein OR1_03733 [Geobacter sp. OR-1]